jgi:squalene-hopene/tetraprenyl-beta-curcumene cyclase
MGILACRDLDRSAVAARLALSAHGRNAATVRGGAANYRTGFPKGFYLKYDFYRQNFPLMALATYANYRSGLGHQPSFYRCS